MNNKFWFLLMLLLVPFCVSGDWVRPKTVGGSGTGDNITIIGGNATPGGSDTQVQFNDGGSFNGSQDFTFNKTSKGVIINSTFNTIYTVGDPVMDDSLINYNDLVGDDCPSQGDFTNNGVDSFEITISAINLTENGFYVSSEIPISTSFVGDGTTEECWNFDINWSDVPKADFYQVAASYFGDGLNIDGMCILPTDSNTNINYVTSWIDCVTAFTSPYNYETYKNGIKVLGDQLITHSLNVTDTIYGYDDLKICNSAGSCAVVTRGAALDYPSGIVLAIGGSPRLCFNAGTQRVCIDYDSGGMRFIQDDTMKRILYASSLEYNIYTDGAITYQIKSGKVTEYGDIATEGFGQPVIFDDVSLTGQRSNISIKAMTNTATAGQYRVGYYMYTTTGNSTYNMNITLNLTWNDGTTLRNIAVGTINTSNITAPNSMIQGNQYIRLGSGSISYLTTNDTGNSTARYALYMTAERVN